MLGDDPATGLPVSLRKGPYGHYVQLGEASGNGVNSGEAAATDSSTDKEKANKKGRSKTKAKTEAEQKPKRISLPRDLDPETLDLEKALALLSLPRTLGTHPESGETITAGLGRFGPYLRSGDLYVSLRGDDDVLSIGLNRAIDLLSRARPGKAKGKNLGAHPEDGKPVLLKAGRYGAYVEHGDVRATLPAGTDPEALDVTQAAALLAEKAGRTAPKRKSKPPAPSRPTGRQARLARPPLHPESQQPSAPRSPRPGRSGRSSEPMSRLAATQTHCRRGDEYRTLNTFELRYRKSAIKDMRRLPSEVAHVIHRKLECHRR